MCQSAGRLAFLVGVLGSALALWAGAGSTTAARALVPPTPLQSAGVDTSSITLILGQPEYGACGDVSINGVVLTTIGYITRLSWDWGDGAIGDSWFPASHHYAQNGSYLVQVTAYSSTGETKSETKTADITNAQDPGCDYTLRLHPATVALRDGQTVETLRLEIRGADGELVSPAGHQPVFTSSNPSLVQVDADGTVTSTGFGEADIQATVSGIPRAAVAKVTAGHFRVEPPILLLSMDHPTGALTLAVANADGTPVNLAGRTVSFAGGNSVATVDGTGLVTALRPPQTFDETPYITAFLDGVPSTNSAVIRVTTSSLGLTPFPLEQPNIAFYMPGQIGTFNYSQIFSDYDVPRITNLGYELERELTSLVPFKGDLQWLVNDPYVDDDTGPCGLSGNPVRLGTDVDKPVHNSCLIIAYTPPIPQWGIYFHEMGHNFAGASLRFSQFAGGSNVGNSNFTYSEGLATAMGLYTAQMMSQRAAEYGIPSGTLGTIMSTVWHFGSTPDLDAYVAGGAHYAQINPSVVDDIIMVLVDQYGLDSLYRLFSPFLPADRPLPIAVDSDAKQATFFVAIMSAATGTDLRTRFRNQWGFPVDDSFYATAYPPIEQLVRQRDPASYAGQDRVLPLPQSVTLDDSYVFDWEADPLAVTWEIVSKPAGSVASLSNPAALHPSVGLDQPGVYVLSLTASDGFITGAADIVSLTLAPGPDLIEMAVSDPPASLNRGTSFSVTDTARNQGTVAVARSSTRYYLSLDTVRNTGDKLLTGARSVPALAAGATSTGNKTVTIPATTALGTYYLLACADDKLLVSESHEDNNCIASAGTIQVTAPDLRETALSNPPASVKKGGSFGVTDTAQNVGTGPAGVSTTQYYLSLDKVVGAGDVLLTGSRAVPALAPGATSTGTVSVTVPATTPLGTYYLLACADDLKVVKESKEGNNCRASLTTIQIVP